MKSQFDKQLLNNDYLNQTVFFGGYEPYLVTLVYISIYMM